QQTDPLTHARLHRTMRALGGTRFYPIQTNSQSGMFETGYHSDRLRIRARGITAEDRNYVYLQPFGREVPAEVRYGQFALDTKYAVGSWNVGIRYIANQKELTKRNNDHSYVFDWSQLNNGIKGTAVYSGKALTLAGNVHYEDITTKAPGIQRKNDAITRLSLNLNLSEGAPNSFGFSSGIDIDHNKSAHSLRAVYRHKPTHNWSTQLEASYSETLPIDQQSFGYWITRGYNFYRELGIKLDPGLRVTKNRLLYYRLETTLKVHQHVTFLLNTDLTHHKRLNIPWQEISYDAQTGSSPGIFVISGEEGTRFGLETSASYQTNEWLRQGISFQMNRTLLGSSRYKNYFRQVPTIHMKYRVDVTPIESFALSFEGRYRSSTKWKEFDALDGREYEDIDNLFPVFTGIYHSTVPPQLDLEIGAQKGFWEQRLSLQVTIQNLLNREIRLHPFGADRALMFNIKAVAEF
ncbi:MAG: hypothetical protein R3222_09050, partial [Balneolaceae bacterium]|nr:hypothetical protein [Balneolaceae bacterium]